MRLCFEWDVGKADANRRKHKVRFEECLGVFRDPLAVSVVDLHSDPASERWVTLGLGSHADLLVVVHTWVESSQDVEVRFISARQPRDAALSQGNMKDEYDFQAGERGRFFRHHAVLAPPIHLDPEILTALATCAEARGVSLSDLVNKLLRDDLKAMPTFE